MYIHTYKHTYIVKSQVYLGINLDVTMSLIPLMKSIKKRVSNKIFMLKKIRKYLTFDAAVTVYKQTILPVIDYAGFLLLACSQGDLDDLQVLQNDILRICTKTKLSDRISIEELHIKCKIISLRQRMEKQLLWLMYVLSKDEKYCRIATRETRSADKIVFKVPTKILPVYDKSPYYIGTKLWNKLSKEIQKKENVHVFKREVERRYRNYKKL